MHYRFQFDEPRKSTDQEPAQRPGLSGWLAPFAGVAIAAIVHSYIVIVNRMDFDAISFYLMCGIGGVAGVIVWLQDCFRERRRVPKKTKPLKVSWLPYLGSEIAQFRGQYEVSPLPPAECERNPRARTCQFLGCCLVLLFIVSLFVGRLIIALFFPEFREGSLTWSKLFVLIPFWAMGLIGVVLILIAYVIDRRTKLTGISGTR